MSAVFSFLFLASSPRSPSSGSTSVPSASSCGQKKLLGAQPVVELVGCVVSGQVEIPCRTTRTRPDNDRTFVLQGFCDKVVRTRLVSTVILICVDGKVQLRVKSKTAASRSSSSRSPGCTVHSLYITVQEYLEVSAVRQVDKVRLCQLLPARQDGRLQGAAHTESCRCH